MVTGMQVLLTVLQNKPSFTLTNNHWVMIITKCQHDDQYVTSDELQMKKLQLVPEKHNAKEQRRVTVKQSAAHAVTVINETSESYHQ